MAVSNINFWGHNLEVSKTKSRRGGLVVRNARHELKNLERLGRHD